MKGQTPQTLNLKALTARSKWAIKIPTAAIHLLCRSQKPALANAIFIFLLCKAVKYNIETTSAADFENVKIPLRELMIAAESRDHKSKGRFFADTLKADELYEIDEQTQTLKPTKALIYALTEHNSTFSRKTRYKLPSFLILRYADLMAFNAARRAFKGVNRELTTRLFLFLVAFATNPNREIYFTRETFNIPKCYKVGKLLNPTLNALFSLFFENFKILRWIVNGNKYQVFFTNYTPRPAPSKDEAREILQNAQQTRPAAAQDEQTPSTAAALKINNNKTIKNKGENAQQTPQTPSTQGTEHDFKPPSVNSPAFENENAEQIPIKTNFDRKGGDLNGKIVF